MILSGNSVSHIPEIEPDEWDKKLIADSKENNDETMSLDDFVEELGFNPAELQV